MAESLLAPTLFTGSHACPYILQLDGICKRFPGQQHPVLEEIQFRLPQGDLLGIVGPSGCGKTTLLRTIAGFEQPDRGQIVLGNRVVAGAGQWIPPEQRGVGLVFQDFALFPHLDVLANVMFGLRPTNVNGLRPTNVNGLRPTNVNGLRPTNVNGLRPTNVNGLRPTNVNGPKFSNKRDPSKSSQEANDRAYEVLRLVGLEAYAHRYPHELSGGQQQRVALARALAPNPSLILLDEPLSNLDVQVRHYLREEIRKILKETQTSAIFVTHDQEEALCLSDWVAVMSRGRIEQWGSPEEIYQDPATRFVAEFITQANFLTCERQEQGWQAENWLRIPTQVLKAPPDPELHQGELMVRQEDLQLFPDPSGEITIRDRQFLGREYRYCLISDAGKELHALTREVLPIGSRVQIAVEKGRLFPVHEARFPLDSSPKDG
ncbi:ABC transporter ATP-binding protein [Synechococcus sp. Nb3U1]|uniref:ABC transporter ATP-binding protein n=1 Tax=Synechococcus sp. Nb3U1 TaxID=1914529 RepID=UPI001F29958A|nr:ABC transporter ATP-binding protein [Synechococcus sp. Nb3U1]MCF2971290.1 ABC transporter ATP-binding protein [Synechococcus sp. Nb3U1]